MKFENHEKLLETSDDLFCHGNVFCFIFLQFDSFIQTFEFIYYCIELVCCANVASPEHSVLQSCRQFFLRKFVKRTQVFELIVTYITDKNLSLMLSYFACVRVRTIR